MFVKKKKKLLRLQHILKYKKIFLLRAHFVNLKIKSTHLFIYCWYSRCFFVRCICKLFNYLNTIPQSAYNNNRT